MSLAEVCDESGNPKHSYEVKRSLIEEKESLEAITRRIVVLQRVVEHQAQGLDLSDGNQSALLQRGASLSAQVDSLRASVDSSGAANSTLAELLKQKENQIRSAQTELAELRSRIAGIETIRSEIEGEIATLGLNEEARRVFISFQEICSSPNCGLFVGSSESYGKNLLYLRDQLKDLERNATRAEVRGELLSARLLELTGERDALAAKLQSPEAGSVDRLVSAVQALTKQLVETENERASIEAVHVERSKLFRLEQERSRFQDRIEEISSSGRQDNDFNRLRFRLRELSVKWMDILETQNVSRNVDIDRDFRFRFNDEPLDVFSGSTKIRLVLAIHAALFEHYISVPSNPFRFLILDTPKQQELQTSDLAKYLTALENVCLTNNAQLILSSTEYDHPTQNVDKRWLPMYSGRAHPMFLGPPSERIQ
jgi:predicted nuclease with TOPRIM domain